MKPKLVKRYLMSEITKVANNPDDYCMNPGSDFTRKRKLPLEKLLTGVIGMAGGSLTNELLDWYNLKPDAPTASAFVQQRSKIKPEAFEEIFKSFSKKTLDYFKDDMPVLSIDGSKIRIATDKADVDSYFPGANGQRGYNLLKLNALYDIEHGLYSDAIIQKARHSNEHKAFIDLVDRSEISKALVIADRGYESYNNIAHIQEKGWYYLIRVKDGKHGIKEGLSLPEKETYDFEVSLKLTRKHTKNVRELLKKKNQYKYLSSKTIFDFIYITSDKSEAIQFYDLTFRIVRFPISEDTYETVITNLDKDIYPSERLKELYASRWGIETSFRDLKYTIGLVNFHSKKVLCIQQEIYAQLTMYNFAQMITSHVVIKKKQRKHTYKANFSVAVHMCRLFYRKKTTTPILEAIISRNLIPIRLNRHRERKLSSKSFRGFLYRIA